MLMNKSNMYLPVSVKRFLILINELFFFFITIRNIQLYNKAQQVLVMRRFT